MNTEVANFVWKISVFAARACRAAAWTLGAAVLLLPVGVLSEISCRSNNDDALIDELAAQGIAYVPFFPLGGFSPLQSSKLDATAAVIIAESD